MKDRSIEAIRDEIIADRDMGETIGQLADQVSESTLEQVISDGAAMLQRGPFSRYEIEVPFAVLAFALQDKLSSIISSFAMDRGTMTNGYRKTAVVLPKKTGQDFERIPGGPVQNRTYVGGSVDDIVAHAVELAQRLSAKYPGAMISVHSNDAENLKQFASGLGSIDSMMEMMKWIQLYEKYENTASEESYAYQYLGRYDLWVDQRFGPELY